MLKPIPHMLLGSIYELTPQMLKERGIKLLLLDLDNTLVPYHIHSPTISLRNWIDGMRHSGIEPFVFSNSRKPHRAEAFAKALGVGYVNRAAKPSPKKLLRLLDEKGILPDNAAIIGDQIYTDVLCGIRAGIFTIAVKPIDLKNLFRQLRYGLESPFRKAAYIRDSADIENTRTEE